MTTAYRGEGQDGMEVRGFTGGRSGQVRECFTEILGTLCGDRRPGPATLVSCLEAGKTMRPPGKVQPAMRGPERVMDSVTRLARAH